MVYGLSGLTVKQFQDRVGGFNPGYAKDWNVWLARNNDNEQQLFIHTMRNWKACRPAGIRLNVPNELHERPFLSDILAVAEPLANGLKDFDIKTCCETSSFRAKLAELWESLKCICYNTGDGLRYNTSVVPISKAALLLTEGAVGPAFDSVVRDNLGIAKIISPEQWINVICLVSCDIKEFERRNKVKIEDVVPDQFKKLKVGRLYDMALGPR